MKSLIAKVGVAVLVIAGGLSATVSTASARGPESEYGMWNRDYGPREWRGHERRRDMCSPGFAEEKASRMGLRRAQVIDVSRRSVVVAGFDRGGRDRIVFANVRGCPVIRR